MDEQMEMEILMQNFEVGINILTPSPTPGHDPGATLTWS